MRTLYTCTERYHLKISIHRNPWAPGIHQCLKHNLSEKFEKVSIGTTQFENAVKQRKDLSKVALFRLCYPATIAIPPLRVPGLHKFFYLNGGCETDGTTISHVDEDQLTQKTREVYNEGRSNATCKSKNIMWAY